MSALPQANLPNLSETAKVVLNNTSLCSVERRFPAPAVLRVATARRLGQGCPKGTAEGGSALTQASTAAGYARPERDEGQKQPMMPPKAFVAWSSGKDSAFALHEARRAGIDIAGVLTTINEVFDRVAMHGVRHTLLNRQIAALGVPAIKVPIPSPCPNEVYEARMAEACATIKARGVNHIVFGDLYLEDIRAWRVEKLAATGMEAVFPLWNRDTAALARTMIDSGVVAYITCLDPRRLPRRFAGRAFDHALLSDLPDEVDPCGENGEFHTVVTAGPMFAAPLAVQVGETVEREGFVFTDVIAD